MLQWKKKYGDLVEYYFHPIFGGKQKLEESFKLYGDDHIWVVKFQEKNPKAKIFLTNHLGKVMVLLLDPELIRIQALNQVYYERRGMDQIWQSGKILTKSLIGDIAFEKWKQQKAILWQGYTFDKMKSQVEVVKQIAKNGIEKFKQNYINTEEWDLEQEISFLTAEVIVQNFLGKNSDTKMPDPQNPLKKVQISQYIVKSIADVLVYTVSKTHFVKRSFLGKRLSDAFCLNKKQKQMLKQINNLKSGIKCKIDEKIKNFDHNNKEKSIIDLYIQKYLEQKPSDPHQITQEEIEHQLIAFTAAGLGNTSNLISKMIYYLDLYPEVKSRIEKELNEIFKSSNDITYENLQKMLYASAYIKEVLRYECPVAKSLLRLCVKTHKIGEFVIEQGWLLQSYFHSNHRSSRYFEDTDTFKPERFLENANLERSNAYLPFYVGNHFCIGKSLAEIEAKIILIYFVMNFNIKCKYQNHSDIKIKQQHTFQSIDPYLVQITSKNNENF